MNVQRPRPPYEQCETTNQERREGNHRKPRQESAVAACCEQCEQKNLPKQQRITFVKDLEQLSFSRRVDSRLDVMHLIGREGKIQQPDGNRDRFPASICDNKCCC